MNFIGDILYQKLVNFEDKLLLWFAMVLRDLNGFYQFRPSSI